MENEINPTRLTYGQLVKLKKCLDEIKKNGVGVSHIPFKTSVILAGVAIAPHLKVAEEMQEPYPEMKEFRQKLNDLIFEHCEKDSTGEPVLKTDPYPKFGAIVIVGNGYFSYSDEHYSLLQKAKKELNDSYQVAINLDKDQSKAYEELLKQEISDSISFKSLHLDKLPPELPIHIIETFIEVGLVTIE